MRSGRCIIERGFFRSSGSRRLLARHELMEGRDVRLRKLLALPGEVGGVRIKLSESPPLQMGGQRGMSWVVLVIRISSFTIPRSYLVAHIWISWLDAHEASLVIHASRLPSHPPNPAHAETCPLASRPPSPAHCLSRPPHTLVASQPIARDLPPPRSRFINNA